MERVGAIQFTCASSFGYFYCVFIILLRLRRGKEVKPIERADAFH
jgi:hypothetical protein